MDDMFLEDLNPCLTLFAKSNSKEIGYASPRIQSNSRWIANMATLPTQQEFWVNQLIDHMKANAHMVICGTKDFISVMLAKVFIS
ncbi:hypothetical protein L2E82_47925 [Cichorium intybus]|uniref:Uncharacterized protein n=1 Tax=Cichorium intybus TaxID=13427 RepID=A0ACB8YW11_CICIN|nr:hypothetical protein L2E82_47925 [Cichorium intybus]